MYMYVYTEKRFYLFNALDECARNTQGIKKLITLYIKSFNLRHLVILLTTLSEYKRDNGAGVEGGSFLYHYDHSSPALKCYQNSYGYKDTNYSKLIFHF